MTKKEERKILLEVMRDNISKHQIAQVIFENRECIAKKVNMSLADIIHWWGSASEMGKIFI